MHISTLFRITLFVLLLGVLAAAGIASVVVSPSQCVNAFLADPSIVISSKFLAIAGMVIAGHTDETLLTEVDAAQFLNLSVRTLQSWRVSGSKIPFIRCGRAVRYKLGDLRAWIKANTVSSTTEADARSGAQ